MSDPSTAGAGPRYNLGYRLLRVFADIRPGEASKALLLALNVFLLLLAYYILKPLRESLLLVDKDSAVVKSLLGGNGRSCRDRDHYHERQYRPDDRSFHLGPPSDKRTSLL